MRTAKKRRCWAIAIFAALGVLMWAVLGFWAVSLSEEHNWLSSFVEISFALNTSLSVAKVRSILIRPLYERFYGMIEEIKLEKGVVDDKTTNQLKSRADEMYSKFDIRIANELSSIVKSGWIAAIMSLVVLLTDCDTDLAKFIPILMSPVIAYIIGVSVEYYNVTGEFAAECEQVVEPDEVQRKKLIDKKVSDKLKKNDIPLPINENEKASE